MMTKKYTETQPVLEPGSSEFWLDDNTNMAT